MTYVAQITDDTPQSRFLENGGDERRQQFEKNIRYFDTITLESNL